MWSRGSRVNRSFLLSILCGALMLLVACNASTINDTSQLPTLAVLPTLTVTSLPPSLTPLPVTSIVGIPTPTPISAFGEVINDLVEGQDQGGLLEADSLEQIFTFEGASGQVVNIRLARLSGNADPFLRLISPDGAVLAVDDNSGGDDSALLRNVVLPENGE